MAISEFRSLLPARGTIVFGGEQPSDNDARSFTTRGYAQLLSTEQTDLTSAAVIASIGAVVFTVTTGGGSDLKAFLEKYADVLLDHDCRIYVRVNRQKELQAMARTIVINAVDECVLPVGWVTKDEARNLQNPLERSDGMPFAPFVYICDLALGWDDIAQLIAKNAAGDAPAPLLQVVAVDIAGAVTQLPPSRETLVRRAFSDCTKVRLVQMADGLSGAKVFRAFSEPSAATPGSWPLIHFVKLDARRSIVSEYIKYHEEGLDFVPFHLAPHLDDTRCALGARDGILVGDLIQDAVSLREYATTGFAAVALSNLFNKTLRPWHHAAMKDEARSVADYFDGRYQTKIIFPTTIPPKRLLEIQRLGGDMSLTDLENIFKAQDHKPTRIGTIHGDLNATNVLVRNTDAIIIDFNDIQANMPLVYDAACLEGGLLVDGFVKDTRSPKDWLASIAPLYQKAALVDWIESCHPSDASRWFYDCVRQIRIHAKQFECQPGQYATVLALTLLKKACNSHSFEDSAEPSDRKRAILRAGAYVLGQQILRSLK
ncbi:phosphotransferase [Rhodanobacter sp. DHG33]|uniref:phosphotransferase n=1 Tax=Rhodanobacter sp. DHG33 TaxID=2775921 RepID=UPI00177D9646|nr:phosphotransferase [Rhodanobacter sp. DHG33]MBD8900361.1 phosphotransferase [Rhodanobacter sp. DHG33]